MMVRTRGAEVKVRNLEALAGHHPGFRTPTPLSCRLESVDPRPSRARRTYAAQDRRSSLVKRQLLAFAHKVVDPRVELVPPLLVGEGASRLVPVRTPSTTTIGARTTKIARTTCSPAPVSDKKVLSA